MKTINLILCGLLSFFSLTIEAKEPLKSEPIKSFNNSKPTMNVDDLPTSLKDWVKWVKFNEKKCPAQINNKEKNCFYPHQLQLEEENNYYKFKLNVYSYDSDYIALPYGESGSWPSEVKLNNQEALLAEKNQIPHLVIKAGENQIEGKLKKESGYFLPGIVAQIAYFDNKTKSKLNQINNKIATEEIEKSSKEVFSQKVYRKLSNQIPYQLTTQIILTYSGEERDYNLGKILPENFYLTSYSSSLALQKEDNFIVRLTNGEHRITLNAISKNKTAKININGLITNHNEEFWSIENTQADNFVKFANLASVDPARLNPQPGWANLGVWKAEKEINLVEEKIEKRNFTASLDRKMWLEEEQDQWIINDKLKISNPDREKFYLPKEFKVEEAKLNNVRRLILKDNGGNYIFLSGGEQTLDLLMKQAATYQVNLGYSDNLQEVKINLVTPPRWRLNAVTGDSSTPGSWLDSWTFYDLFAMFFIVIAFYRLIGIWPAAISAISLLIFHGNTFLSWGLFIWLILVVALLKVLPRGGLRKLVNVIGGILLISLSFYVINFITVQIRYIINPSLEAWQSYAVAEHRPVPPASPVPMRAKKGQMPAVADMAMSAPMEMQSMVASSANVSEEKVKMEKNILQEKVNVSLGTPKWQGRNYQVNLLGMQPGNKELAFYLAGPTMVNLFKIIELINLVIIIAWLTLILFNIKFEVKNWQKIKPELLNNIKESYFNWKKEMQENKEKRKLERIKKIQERAEKIKAKNKDKGPGTEGPTEISKNQDNSDTIKNEESEIKSENAGNENNESGNNLTKESGEGEKKND